jgi:hypothetical protein
MNKKVKKISVFIISTAVILSAVSVFALNYTPLEPNAFPGLGDTSGTINTNSLSGFLSNIFSFGIAIAVALSVVMIAWGGIQYMTTDSWLGKQDGKSKVESALYGLALALISWLILYTINPNLVNFGSNTIIK